MRNLKKSQSHLDGAWASLGKGPAEDMELLKHLDTVSKWTEAKEEMAHPPCLSPLSRAASLFVIALALLDSSDACKACCVPGLPWPCQGPLSLPTAKRSWRKGVGKRGIRGATEEQPS